MKSIYKKFKQLTSFSYTDIAVRLEVSRQAVNNMLSNHSITHINANKWILTKMIDECIINYQRQIEQLQELRKEIEEYKVIK